MINTKSVIQVLVNIEGITSVQVLKDKLQSAIGNVSIVRYSVTPKHAIMYIEVIPTKGLVTFELEVDGKEFSLINVVEDIVKENPSYTEGSVQEAFTEEKSDEPLAAMAIIFDHDPQIDYLLTKEFKLSQLSTYDGLVSISTDKDLVLIEKQCNVVIDYSTYNKETGTVRLLQTSKTKEPEISIHYDENHTEEDIKKIKNNLSSVKTIDDILTTLHAIDNDQPYILPEKTSTYHNKNVIEMQKLLDVMKPWEPDIKDDEVTKSSTIDISEEDDNSPTKNVKHYSIDKGGYQFYGIGDTVLETIELKVALISIGKFDEYAASHNIVGWDLFTPTTVRVKYLEGSNTPIENIQKFHNMMNELDMGWIETQNQISITSKFVEEIFDRDLVQEFLNRVNKHNTFVRESTAKIRKALLDMEQDFNSLKDEINLIIDWEELTAHASRKERTEIRISGVHESGSYSDGDGKIPYNLVKVNSELKNCDFYIPIDLLTNEIRSKYVLDDFGYYIENVPSFAFYEVPVNGHVMLIEKTDL